LCAEFKIPSLDNQWERAHNTEDEYLLLEFPHPAYQKGLYNGGKVISKCVIKFKD
jgi:hypothetical protein